jgi:alkyl sulfatase BDS1-like metallo-beta-lactamase superfamily hydrolase
MLAALTPSQLLDSLAIRVNGPRAWDLHVTLDWVVVDTDQTFRLQLRNGVLTYSTFPQRDAAQAVVTASRAGLLGVLAGAGDVDVEVQGDQSAVATLLSVLDAPDPDFAIVTP